MLCRSAAAGGVTAVLRTGLRPAVASVHTQQRTLSALAASIVRVHHARHVLPLKLQRFSPSSSAATVLGRSALSVPVLISAPPRQSRGASTSASSPPKPAPKPTPPVSPPRLVFEVQPPLTMRWQTVFNGLQGVFWSGIYGVHFVAPEAVELWWGALGMAVTIGWQAMLYFRAHRSVNELAVYSGGAMYRVSVATVFGRPILLDIPVRDVGPNPAAVTNGKYWIFKVRGQHFHYLLDRQQGTIYDLRTLNTFLGYDVADTIELGKSTLRTWENVQREESRQQEQTEAAAAGDKFINTDNTSTQATVATATAVRPPPQRVAPPRAVPPQQPPQAAKGRTAQPPRRPKS